MRFERGKTTVEQIDQLIKNRREQDELRERRRHTEEDLQAYRRELIEKYDVKEKER